MTPAERMQRARIDMTRSTILIGLIPLIVVVPLVLFWAWMLNDLVMVNPCVKTLKRLVLTRERGLAPRALPSFRAGFRAPHHTDRDDAANDARLAVGWWT